MKKYLALCLALMFVMIAVFSVTGCQEANDDNSEKKISVVATVFPAYDFAKRICGENAEVTMLLPAGTEVHTYEPSVQDVEKIQNCSLLIYTGGESDTWVEEIRSSITRRKMITLTLMSCVEGIAVNDEHETSDNIGGTAGEDHAHKEMLDEHVWTSPKNAIKIANAICEKMCHVDAEHEEIYKSNTQELVSELTALDTDFKSIVNNGKRATVVFADRFPLIYFTTEYGLDYVSAFNSCSEESEPSAATVSALIDKVKADKIPVVFYIEFSNEQLADTVCEATGAKKLRFHSCHNVSAEDFAAGVTYVDLMRQNLAALMEALG